MFGNLDRLRRYRWLLAAAAGGVWALAFPPLQIAGLAWIAPALMLAASAGGSRGEMFRAGYLAGLVHHLVKLYWLLHIPYGWHGIPIGPAAGWLALSGYLAFFPALWCVLAWRWFPADDKNNWLNRTRWTLLAAALWTGLEWVQAHFLSGFPWGLLGISQSRMSPFVQVASLAGVAGLSFLIVWFATALFNAAAQLRRKPGSHRSLMGEIVLPLLVIIIAATWGYQRIIARSAAKPERTLRLALLQPSIPQELIWDSSEDGSRFAKLLKMSEAAAATKPDAIIWPEAALPALAAEDFEAVRQLARQHQVPILFGTDDVELTPTATNFFNAAVLIGASGEVLSVYHKQQLVMFGEYIPFSRTLPFLKNLLPVGNFAPGEKPGTFTLSGKAVRLGLLICFEDVFSALGRTAAAADDPDVLLNLTNDGWFGQSAEQWQHAANAVFRAVETGRPLVRCTNNGLTCWVDACGQLRQIFRDGTGSVYGEGIHTVEIPLPAAGTGQPRTVFQVYGDWLGTGCAALTLLLAALSFRRRQ